MVQGRGLRANVTIKRECKRNLGGDVRVLYLDFSSDYTTTYAITLHRIIHTYCIDARFLILILYYNSIESNKIVIKMIE